MDGNTKLSRVSSEAIQPETDFADFLHGVISRVYDLNNRKVLDNVKSALNYTRRLKCETDNSDKIYLSFKRPQVRCAYLYAYSVLHSTMVYFEFSKLLNPNKTCSLPACHKDSLKICCLSGGPGIDAIAICRSIFDAILKPDIASHHSISVHITMIDKHPHWWRREVAGMVDAMNDSSNVLHSKRIIFHSDFLKADISKSFEDDLRQKIQEADIVTLVKLADSSQDDSPERCDREQLMMENIIKSMRENSCLFMIDTDEGKFFNNRVECLRDNGRQSYMNVSMNNSYSLEARTLKKFENMMKLKTDPNHRTVLPTVKGKACSCLWIKDTSIFSDNSAIPDLNNIDRTSNFSNTVCSALQSEKDISLDSQNSCSPITSNEDDETLTYSTQSKEQRKKSKHTVKENMKRKANKQTLSMLYTMIVLTMILRGHS